MNKKKKSIKLIIALIALLTVTVSVIFLSSCEDGLDIRQSYPFTVETMPVPKELVKGETAEIRCELRSEGHFEGTVYTIRYFQYDGRGKLKLENGTALMPNDRYLLEDGKFRLYYTSESNEMQNLTVTIEDNFGKAVAMEFSFNAKDITDEKEGDRVSNG